LGGVGDHRSEHNRRLAALTGSMAQHQQQQQCSCLSCLLLSASSSPLYTTTAIRRPSSLL